MKWIRYIGGSWGLILVGDWLLVVHFMAHFAKRNQCDSIKIIQYYDINI